LPTKEEAFQKVIAVASSVKEAREQGHFECPRGGCFACRPYETILSGKAQSLGVGGYGQDVYMITEGS
jgi:hypothetical protein